MYVSEIETDTTHCNLNSWFANEKNEGGVGGI